MVEGYIQLRPRGLWGIKARQINISLFAPFQAYPGTNQAYWWEFWKSEVHPEEANSLLGKSKSCEYKYIFPHQSKIMWQNSVGFCLSNPWLVSTFSPGRLHLHIEGFNQENW